MCSPCFDAYTSCKDSEVGDYMELHVSALISLKTLEPLDDEALFHETDRSRSHLQEWLPWLNGVQTVADSRKFIEYSIQLLDERKAMVFGIFFDGQLVGTISFNQLDWQNRIGHVGYWLSQSFTGQGIMTKAVRRLVSFAFDDLGLNRIEIRCALGNAKSRSIPQRLGFSEEGIVREGEWLYDHFVDHAVYGMLSRDWKHGGHQI